MVFSFPRIVSVSSEPAKHPWVKAPRHPTIDRPGRNGSVGTLITCLHPYGDSVLVGHGDWNANSGPIDIWSINPKTLEWSLESEKLPTESVDNIVSLGDTTIALHTDPLGHFSWDNNTVGTIIGSQEQMAGSRVLHCFDAAELPDGSWWFVGSGWETEESANSRAMGFLSKDRGKSWEQYWSDIPAHHSKPRFHAAKVINGLPAAYSYTYGWAVLEDGKFKAINDKALDRPKLLQVDPPAFIKNASVSKTVSGYSILGTASGDVWIRKEI